MLKPTSLRDKSLLIVENEVIIADDIARLGHELGVGYCHIAFDYQQAIQQFVSYQPELVIIDIKLRGQQSGIEFGQWMRKESVKPIIYVTVASHPDEIKQLIHTKPLAYIPKPFDDKVLKMAMKQGLSMK
ncbi:response regulator [Roseivirga pacifica]|uniref:response regulator n=1 Tax=Roseivirga pacifica TaxID=1267423 RepID=UPI003BAF4ECD